MPVTWTLKVPGELAVTVRIAVPDVAIVVGFMVAVRPEDGVTVRETVPENPLSAVMVIVEEAGVPALTVRLVGFADMEKSG